MGSGSKDNFNRWKDVWQRKSNVSKSQFKLTDLLALAGYDTAASNLSIEDWLNYVNKIRARLKLKAKSTAMEIGCGGGNLTLPLYQEGIEVYGIDYIENLIRICRDVMPEGEFAVAEARDLPFISGIFDAVLTNGVFIYFPDLDYTEAVIKEIARVLKPHGRAALLDLNDADKKSTYEKIKREKLGEAEYQRLYQHHQHLFFDKTSMIEMAARYNLQAIVEDQFLSGYANAEFRFNIFLEKISNI